MKFKPILFLLGAVAIPSGIALSSVVLPEITNAQNIAQKNTQTESQPNPQKKRGDRLASLNLSEQQKSQLKKIGEQSRSQFEAILTPSQLSKLQAAKGTKVNRREVMSSLGLSEAQKSKMKDLRKSSMEQMKAVLTPEQQRQMRSMRNPK